MSAKIQDNSNNNRTAPENKLNAPTVARYGYLLVGLLSAINGFVYIGDLFGTLGGCTGSNCIGPSLRWGGFNPPGGQGDGQNAGWRNVFSLAPDLFFLNFTPIFLGLLLILIHFPGFNFTFCTKSWLHASFMVLLVVLFGLFPYGGNVGILFGFIALPICFLMLGLAFSKHRHEQTTLLIKADYMHCGCLVDNTLFITVTKVLHLAAGVGVFVIGWVHIGVTNFNWCTDTANTGCIGPSLTWNQGNLAFTANTNGIPNWGSVFSFVPSVFFPLWGPVVLGFISMTQHVVGMRWDAISMSWPRVFVWNLFLAFFAGLGYAGNLGIIVGFLCVAVALFALLLTLGGGARTKTHFEFVVRALHSSRRDQI